MNYELYNTDTGEVVHSAQELTLSEVTQRNKQLRQEESPCRWIEAREHARPDCRCGAESRLSCVCEFEHDLHEHYHE